MSQDLKFWNSEFREENKKRYSTVPFDPRFPNVNQTKNCFIHYVDFHRCEKAKGGENPVCKQMEDVFKELCPNGWIEQWDDWRNNGSFPVRELNTVDPKY
jgi:cytochrome c oxidase subunit 6b